ncbi:MAG: PTS transporter subunit EIIC [Synergistota bacterium]|nr:PTS transporter subunit EIIC [Synergistota bacterium]
MEMNAAYVGRILELLGGRENVCSVANCMTRLRIRLKDASRTDVAGLKALEGVLGVVEGETLQVVVGPGRAKRVADILVGEFGVACGGAAVGDRVEKKRDARREVKRGPFKTALETIAAIFVPLIPAIIASGIFNGLGGLLDTMLKQQLVAGAGWEFGRSICQLVGASFLGYFAIFTGVNAARCFGATEALGGMTGAMTAGAQINEISQLLGLFDPDVPLNSILTTGKGGVIGVILGVYILAKVEKRLRKMVPNVLDLILTPLVALLVVALGMVFVVMPVSGYFSDWLVDALSLIINSGSAAVSIVSGYVLAALFLPMVLLGLHHGLIPIYAIQLQTFGGVSLFPVLAMSGGGQVGAAAAIWLKARNTKNSRIRSVIAGALPAGLLGIGEPLIYGVTLPMGKPFITAGLGAGFGGAYVMATGVMATSWGPSGLLALPMMQPGSMLNYLAGILISYVGGFLITWIFVKESDVAGA